MSAYQIAKAVHVTCVILSIGGFVVRFALSLRASPWLQNRWVRILPHVNDTVLLGAAIAMLVIASLNPFGVAWLNAKIAGLLIYIALGSVALRWGRSPRMRLGAFTAALIAFAYVVAVALGRDPAAPWRALIA
jgi:uncharacterized membrane protein SirB2